MSFDVSRFAFNAWHDFLGVVMQQGRVQLDADWNELVSEMVRRIQTGTLDTFERTVVPRVTPDGFRIEAVAGAIEIGVGRIYVDGILVENHGGAPLEWNPQAAELVGTAAVDYAAQPYYPSPPELPGGGPHLVYLDVWQREVTHLQHPDLVEKAVGIDTTGRLQTVWQVKLLPDIGSAQCATPDEDVPGWAAVIRPSASRLTTATGNVADTPDPCLIPPSGGYRGLENQLYRVEIHDGGAVGTARFKWSRDNGTVSSLVSRINGARDRIVVDSVGRDALLRFSDGDWVEITDDELELHGQPGIVRRIKLGGGVEDATRTIILADALPAGVFPTGAQDQTDSERHTRIRRWDQSGLVLRADGTLFHNLNDAGSDGLVPVPAAGTPLFLENGIVVSFGLDGAGGFRSGDHWCFAARASDASIEILDQAPPRGIHHHYARLAVVTFPDAESDCRVFWPPDAAAGEDCSCDVCVTVEGHTNGTATIQQAIDALIQTGGTICLGAGTYRLREPLRVENAGSLRIRGKGWRTVLVPETSGSVLRIQDSTSVTLEEFAAIGAAGEGDIEALVAARNTVGLELDHLYLIGLSPGDTTSAAVELNGYALGAGIRQCALVADVGITGGATDDNLLLTASFAVADNLLLCGTAGMELGNRSVHYGGTAISRNLVIGSRESGLLARGGAVPGSSFLIDANAIYVAGDAIVAGVDGLRIADNEVRGLPGRQQGGHGIVLASGLDPSGIGHVWITGNRLAGLAGHAIEVQAPLGSATIKQNVLERAHGGIVFLQGGAGAHVSIENNHLLNIAAAHNPAGTSVVGIQVLAAEDVNIVGNVMSHFAEDALQASDRVAIRVAACGAVRISANHLSELGPKLAHAGYVAGVEILTPYSRAFVAENVVLRSAEADLVVSQWQALRIGLPIDRGFVAAAGAMIIAAPSGAADSSFLLTGSRLLSLVIVPPESLSIRGNQGSAREIATQLVIAVGASSCIFSDNHFEAAGRSGARLVELNGNTVIASSNRLRWIGSDQDALNISGARGFTVLGNITMGNIRIGGGLLPEPWDRLNILAS